MEDLITIEKILELGFIEQKKENISGQTWYKKGMIGISKLDENVYGVSFVVSFTFDLGTNEKIMHLHKNHIKYMYELNNLCVALIKQN